MPAPTEPDLRFALTAARLGLVTADQLVLALNTGDGDRPLADRLIADEVLTTDQRAQVEAEVTDGATQAGTLLEISGDTGSVETTPPSDTATDAATLLAIGPGGGDTAPVTRPPVDGTVADDADRTRTQDDTSRVATTLRRYDERYDEMREVGRGGQARIMLAVDRDIDRQVAMKVLGGKRSAGSTPRSGSGTASPFLGRFLDEARLTARLEHPNIVPVHEIGERADGSAYYTMKFVNGRSFAAVLHELRTRGATAASEWPLPRLVRIFQGVCQAVAFAHEHGVIHRDLKPDNVMVGGFGEVYVIDWGLAKDIGHSPDHRLTGRITREQTGARTADATDTDAPAAPAIDPDSPNDVETATLLAAPGRGPAGGKSGGGSSFPERGETLDGSVIGTPAYMPPEQAEGRIQDVDRRADVYSLGAILYEILTLAPPYEGDTVGSILSQVVRGALPDPATRAPERRPPADLSAIATKCLARKKADRYADAAEVLADVERHLSGFTVSAQQASLVRSVMKLVARNRAAAATIAVAACLLTVGVVIYLVNITKAREAADIAADQALAESRRARDAEADARDQAEVARKAREAAERDAARARRAEADSRRSLSGAYRMAARAAQANGDGSSFALLTARALTFHDDPELHAGLFHTQNPLRFDAQYVSTLAIEQSVVVDADTVLLVVRTDHEKRTYEARLCDLRTRHIVGRATFDGELLHARVTPDHRAVFAMTEDGLRHVNLTTGETILTWAGARGMVLGDLDPTGTKVGIGNGAVGEIRDATTGALLLSLEGHTAPVVGVRFRHDGTMILTAAADRTARLWDAEGNLRRVLPLDAPPIFAFFSVDGQYVAVGTMEMKTQVFDASNGEPVVTVNGLSVAADMSRGLYALVSRDCACIGSIRDASDSMALHDRAGSVVRRLEAAEITSAQLDTDGSRLGVLVDGGVRLVDGQTITDIAALQHPDGDVAVQAWSPDGSMIATASKGGSVRLWSAAGELLAVATGIDEPKAVQFSADSRHLVVADSWRVHRLRIVDNPTPAWLLRRASDTASRDFICEDGSRFARFAGNTTRISVTDRTTRAEVAHLRVPGDSYQTRYTPDDRLIITEGSTYRVLDPDTLDLDTSVQPDPEANSWFPLERGLSVTHVGAVVGSELLVRNLMTGEVVHRLPVPDEDDARSGVIFGGDDGVLVIEFRTSRTIDIRRMRDGELLRTATTNIQHNVQISPDGHWMLSVMGTGMEVFELLPPEGQQPRTYSFTIEPDRQSGFVWPWDRLLVNSATGASLVHLETGARQQLDVGSPPMAVQVLPGNERALVVGESRSVVCEVATGAVVYELPGERTAMAFELADLTAGIGFFPAAALAPDGSSFLTVLVPPDDERRERRTVECRDTATGELRFAATIKSLRRACYSPDGSRVMIAGDRVVEWRAVADGSLLRTDPQPAGITGVVLSPDRRQMLVRMIETTAWIDTATGEVLDTLHCQGAQFTPARSQLVVFEGSTTLELHRMDRPGTTLEHTWELAGRPHEVRLSRDGSRLVTSPANGRLCVIDVGADAPREMELAAPSASRQVRLSPDGERLVFGVAGPAEGDDVTWSLADPATGEIRSSWTSPDEDVRVCFGPTRTFVCHRSNWVDLETATPLETVRGREGLFVETSAGALFVAVHEHRLLGIDLDTGDERFVVDVPGEASYREAALHVADGLAAVVPADGMVVALLDLESPGAGFVTATVGFTATDLAFARDGGIAVVMDSKNLVIVDPAIGQVLASVLVRDERAHLHNVYPSPDGRRITIADTFGVVCWNWQLDPRAILLNLRMDTGRIERDFAVEPEPRLGFPLDTDSSVDPVAGLLAANPPDTGLAAARARLQASDLPSAWSEKYPKPVTVDHTRDVILRDPQPALAWLALFEHLATQPHANTRRLLVLESFEVLPESECTPALRLLMDLVRTGGQADCVGTGTIPRPDGYVSVHALATRARRLLATGVSDDLRPLLDAIAQLDPAATNDE